MKKKHKKKKKDRSKLLDAKPKEEGGKTFGQIYPKGA